MQKTADINLVMVGGTLVDPPIVEDKNGKLLVKFTLRNEKFKKNSSNEGFTLIGQYFQIHCWDNTAKEFVKAAVKKGEQLVVIGRLDQFVATKKFTETTENGAKLEGEAKNIYYHINAMQFQFFKNFDYLKDSFATLPKTQRSAIAEGSVEYDAKDTASLDLNRFDNER